MPRTIETTVYTYAELSDAAKAKARDWYRDMSRDDSFWHESTIENMVETLNAMGFSIDTARGSKTTPAIFFSGFWSQGDGACFEGSWAPELLWSVERFQTEYPATYKDSEGVEHLSEHNAELHDIVIESNRLAALDLQKGIGWRCKHTGRYNHELSVEFEHWDDREPEHCQQSDQENADCTGPCNCICDCEACKLVPIDGIEEAHEENARDAMRWIYRTLEREYDYQNSDEVVAENIEANDYEFTEEGERA